MPKIIVSQFKGMAPRIVPRSLAPKQAQVATNVSLFRSRLEPMAVPTDTGQAVTVGSDLSEYGTYDSGVGGWANYNSNTNGNDAGAMKGVYVDGALDAQGYSGHYLWLNNAVSLTADLVAGQTYQIVCKGKVDAGSIKVYQYKGVDGTFKLLFTITETDLTTHTGYMTATTTTGDALVIYYSQASGSCWIDDLTVKLDGVGKTIWKCGSTFIFPGTLSYACTVIDSPIQESNNRFLYTGHANPKQSDSTAWAAGTSYRLGVTPPAVAPTITIHGTADADVQDYVSYVFTMVTAWGEESEPGPASAVATVMKGQHVDLSVMTTPTDTQANFQYKRIYRLSSGKAGGEYLYLAQIAFAETTYADEDDTTHELKACSSDALATTGWAKPPDGLTGLTMGMNNMFFGYYGKEVYVSEPGVPYAYKSANKIALDSDVTGIATAKEFILAVSTRHPYIISGSSPENLDVTKFDRVMKCTSLRGMVPTEKGIYFPAKDGLYFCDGNGIVCVTEATISEAQWEAINTGSFVAKMYENYYLAITSGGYSGILVDVDTGEYSTFDFSAYFTTVYDIFADSATGDLYILGVFSDEPKVYTFATSASELTYLWTSKRFMDSNRFNCAQIRGYFSGGRTVIFRYYLDGVIKQTKTVSSETVFRLCSDSGSKDKEFSLNGTAYVDLVQLATAPEELE